MDIAKQRGGGDDGGRSQSCVETHDEGRSAAMGGNQDTNKQPVSFKANCSLLIVKGETERRAGWSCAGEHEEEDREEGNLGIYKVVAQ